MDGSQALFLLIAMMYTIMDHQVTTEKSAESARAGRYVPTALAQGFFMRGQGNSKVARFATEAVCAGSVPVGVIQIKPVSYSKRYIQTSS